MTAIMLREAISRGLVEALEEDERVFMIGEDIGTFKGPYAVTSGMLDKFGPDRIIDSPI